MKNKENKINAVEVNEEELENVSGGVDYNEYETVTVSGVTCVSCGGTISGTARFYPHSGDYWCLKCSTIHVLS